MERTQSPEPALGGVPAPAAVQASPADAVRRRYDRGARLYDLQVWPMERLMFDKVRRRLMSMIRGPRVLEVGVGTGRNLPDYPAGLEVDAIDISPRMLERARRRRPVRATIRLHEMDAEHLAFPDGVFDTAVATCVFCSVPDPVAGLREARRVLRPGGQFVMIEHMRPGSPWLGSLFDRLDPLVSRFGPHINRLTMQNLGTAGFRIEREENLFSDFVKLIVAVPRG